MTHLEAMFKATGTEEEISMQIRMIRLIKLQEEEIELRKQDIKLRKAEMRAAEIREWDRVAEAQLLRAQPPPQNNDAINFIATALAASIVLR